MKGSERDEFYIGYLPQAPRRLAIQVRRFCLALFAAAVLTAILLVIGQHRFPLSIFEFQQYRQFEGFIREQPYPTLLVPRPGEIGKLPAASSYLLVSPGKHGAENEAAGFDGKRVRLQGSLIYRDGISMIEIVPHSLKTTGETSGVSGERQADSSEDLGIFTLAGEIVDSKCYLGVMNPGHTKPHRECAARCISGGAPPLFIARDAEGRTVSLLLVSLDRQPVNREVLDVVAEPVEISGRVVREGDQLILQADPKTYRRID
ncbi:MAG TPA: hypothetical protein VJ302_21530 [Blastocatellia bacterium]|nr:hypothetical protein [Blastocatellia bacterium]